MPVRIEAIAVDELPLGPDASIDTAVERFLARPELAAAPIVFDGAPLGLVGRSKLPLMLRKQVGGGGRAPISQFMDASPVLAEAEAPVAAVAAAAAEAGSNALSDGAIVVRDGVYAGIVAPDRLLATVAIENAARAKALLATREKAAAAKAAADAAAKSQAEFIAYLAHEIRTPLTGVLGVADLLCDAKLDPDARRLAGAISASGGLLERLLSDMLDLAQMDAGKFALKPAPFNLREFAKEISDLWSAQADRAGIAFNVRVTASAMDRLEADAFRLRQVIFNLVNNALKFTHAGGVDVALETAKAADGALTLRAVVSDTGLGVPDADKSRLFEAFEQASPHLSIGRRGVGLGLAIARGLVGEMGGDIKLQDNVGQGAVFSIEVPVHRPGPRLAVENKRGRRSANFQLGDVLVVEDHEASRLVIERALAGAGWRVEALATADAALQRLAARPFQAVLLDIHLPDHSGDAVARSIRSGAGRNADTPILAVTADATDARRAACDEAGFSGFIEKPIRPRNLVAALADAVMAAEAAAEAAARRSAL